MLDPYTKKQISIFLGAVHDKGNLPAKMFSKLIDVLNEKEEQDSIPKEGDTWINNKSKSIATIKYVANLKHAEDLPIHVGYSYFDSFDVFSMELDMFLESFTKYEELAREA